MCRVGAVLRQHLDADRRRRLGWGRVATHRKPSTPDVVALLVVVEPVLRVWTFTPAGVHVDEVLGAGFGGDNNQSVGTTRTADLWRDREVLRQGAARSVVDLCATVVPFSRSTVLVRMGSRSLRDNPARLSQQAGSFEHPGEPVCLYLCLGGQQYNPPLCFFPQRI